MGVLEEASDIANRAMSIYPIKTKENVVSITVATTVEPDRSLLQVVMPLADQSFEQHFDAICAFSAAYREWVFINRPELSPSQVEAAFQHELRVLNHRQWLIPIEGDDHTRYVFRPNEAYLN